MKIITETPRLILREFTMEDAPALIPLHGDWEVIKTTGDRLEGSLEGNQKIIREVWLREYAQYGHARWAVIWKESGQLIGWCGLKFETEIGAVDLGYRFLKEFWGKGIATESAKAALKYGFEELEIPEIHAMALPDNNASVNVMQKCGMHYFKTGKIFEKEGVVQYRISRDQYFKQSEA